MDAKKARAITNQKSQLLNQVEYNAIKVDIKQLAENGKAELVLPYRVSEDVITKLKKEEYIIVPRNKATKNITKIRW